MANFGKGVVILACPNAPDDPTLSVAERLVRKYHFLCPSDFTALKVRKVRPDGDIELRPCSTCGLHWYSPNVKELPKWARPVPG